MRSLPEDWTRAIVVVAHPDDIEYGCASAVARWTDQGKDVRYVLATSGEAGIAGLPPAQCGPLREDEERRSAAVVGVTHVEFLGHRDGQLEAGLALRRDLAAAIRRHRPDVVVTMFFGHAWRPDDDAADAPPDGGVSRQALPDGGFVNSADHRALGVTVLDAVADAANEWIFPELAEQGLAPWPGVHWIAVSGPGRYAVDVSDYVEAGVASLEQHARYLEALGPEPVAVRARDQVEAVTRRRRGFDAEHAVTFALYRA
ncbi:PIG-L deacetylase family protein [Rhodococcus sp. HNM0569]|uniref:PIG-L family deacetylase n=1 Tax=Rhodococcus sp. HNM0569 TaxID=2716340 RepID=UPI00146E2BC3|nr:PIG-L family deacetylase [Rhodococcus sp. HNM0569]